MACSGRSDDDVMDAKLSDCWKIKTETCSRLDLLDFKVKTDVQDEEKRVEKRLLRPPVDYGRLKANRHVALELARYLTVNVK